MTVIVVALHSRRFRFLGPGRHRRCRRLAMQLPKARHRPNPQHLFFDLSMTYQGPMHLLLSASDLRRPEPDTLAWWPHLVKATESGAPYLDSEMWAFAL